MWPFGERLKDQDAVEKFRRWLRRWLLGMQARHIAAAAIAVLVLAALVWTVLQTWSPGDVPAAGDKPAINYNLPVNEVNELENQFVEPKQQEQESGPGPAGAAEEEAAAGAGEENSSLDLVLPVSGQRVSAYGFHYSPLYEDYRFHHGVVLATGEDGRVRSCLPGRVVELTYNGAAGYTVRVEHGEGWASVYEGLQEIAVAKGDTVTAGQSLGRASREGGEITFTLLQDGKPVDPAPYLQQY